MMTNVGVIDRALRVLIGLALFGWADGVFGPPLSGWTKEAVAAIGAYPAITGLLRYCPIFSLAGISSCADEI